MIRWAAIALLALATACSAPDPVERRAPPSIDLPPMKTFGPHAPPRAERSNRSIALDILDLTFELESGQPLPVLSRFEGPITVRVLGPEPPSLTPDLNRLLARMRAEAGLDITRVPAASDAAITIEVVSRRELKRAAREAACIIVPRMSGWEEYRRNPRSPLLDWTTLRERTRMAIFLPGDVSPQEVRDCLHEELAQAVGPLNDLHRLADSVFNDDNFHSILTGFDMLVLKVLYDPALRSGMTRADVAMRLPGILDRLNPRGRALPDGAIGPTPRAWITAIETAQSTQPSFDRRRRAAEQAVRIAASQGWTDARAGFSLYMLGLLSRRQDPETARAAFLDANTLYALNRGTELQAANVAMQLIAIALSTGQAEIALEIADRNLAPAAEAENAALLSTMLMMKAEALDGLDRRDEAAAVRRDALGWARYGFASDEEVRIRLADIRALSPTWSGGGS